MPTLKPTGHNSHGQLGQGSTADIGGAASSMGANIAAINWGTGRTAVDIAAGSSHTCALLDNAVVKCVGNGAQGGNGYGATDNTGIAASSVGDNLGAVDLGTATSRCV